MPQSDDARQVGHIRGIYGPWVLGVLGAGISRLSPWVSKSLDNTWLVFGLRGGCGGEDSMCFTSHPTCRLIIRLHVRLSVPIHQTHLLMVGPTRAPLLARLPILVPVRSSCWRL